MTPPAVAGGTVLVVALAGVAVNVAAALLIARAGGGRGAPRSLNLAGAFRHIVTDLYAFAATAVAGAVILLTGFARADAIATLVVVGADGARGRRADQGVRADLPRGGAGRARPGGGRRGHGRPPARHRGP